MPSTLPSFLWHFAKSYKFYLLGFIFIAFIWAINLSLTPYAIKLIIDQVSRPDEPENLFSSVKYPILLYISLGVILGVLYRFYDWLAIKTFPDLQFKIKQEMFEHVEKHSYSYFQENFSGTLGNKINDMARSSCLIISRLIDCFIARSFGILFGTITMFLIHPYFAFLMVAWSLIFIISSLLLSKKSQYYSEITSNAKSVVVGKIVDNISNILNVKLFAGEKYEKNYLSHYLQDAKDKDCKGQWYLLKIKTFYQISVIFLTSMMVMLLIYERSQNNITVGDFALILTLNMFLVEEVFFIANQLVPFSEELGTCKQALSIITSKHDIVDIPDAKPLIISKGKIVFDRVHFQYKKGESIFSDKSIIIKPGQKVGLVGFSGSGKSTFVNLILRFFDVDSGKILIDDQDIKTVTQYSLKNQIGMIPQDTILFHRTVAENIAYGSFGATTDEIIKASKQAHCHEFIMKLADNYETLVGERGIKLSGGQRQRIAIARAILKNAPILILDEATSSLDSVTENEIQESLKYLMERRTTIVIAHRLSTLFSMDKILVFHEGKIVENGTHTELLDLNGHYKNLWEMQACGFIDKELNPSYLSESLYAEML